MSVHTLDFRVRCFSSPSVVEEAVCFPRGNCQNSFFGLLLHSTNKMLYCIAVLLSSPHFDSLIYLKYTREILYFWMLWYDKLKLNESDTVYWYTLDSHILLPIHFMIFLWFSVYMLPSVLQGCVENQMAAELQDDWLNLTQKERDPWIHLDAMWWVGWRWKPKQNENRAVYFWWPFSTLNTLNTGSFCSFFQDVLHDIFLLDGHEQKTFVFLYLPLFLTNAKVNHDVDLLGALKFLVEIYDRLLQHRCLMLTGLGPRSMSSEFP